MLKFILFFLISLNLIANDNDESSKTILIKKILTLKVDSSINPATLNYLTNGLKKAKESNYDAILVKLNTPGGLITTTKSILTLIGESPIPFIFWITPEGASATSAGAIIASASHILLMDQGTNIGAATPVELGKDIEKSDLKEKAINDISSLIEALAKMRGRNDKLFVEMVKKATSYQSSDALNLNIIDGIASSTKELFNLVNKKEVLIYGQKVILNLSNDVSLDLLEMDLGESLLNILANPMLAYILFILGAVLIYIELQAPGGYIAGGIGSACLLIAGICFQVLPINLGGIGLIILAFILFILEMFVTSFGLLIISGIISLFFGSIFLFSSSEGHVHLERSIIYSVVGAVALFLVSITIYFARVTPKNKNSKPHFSLIGLTGTVVKRLDSSIYVIKLNGEFWNAKSKVEDIAINSLVKVTDHNLEKLLLEIEPK